MALDLSAAISFLRNQMYDPVDKMAKESTKGTGNNYYFNSANGLYNSVMQLEDPTNAAEHLASALQHKKNLGKENTTIYTAFADMLHPTWRTATKTNFAFKNATEQDWGALINGHVLNNNSDLSTKTPDENHINTKVIYVVHQMCQYKALGDITYKNNARAVWQDVINAFNDSAGGYVDSITGYREAYKQGMVKMCSVKFAADLSDIGVYQEPTGMWSSGLQSATTGGINSRYNRVAGNIVPENTFENTEATACIILGYR